MSIFNYSNYKVFLKAHLKNMPKQGRGFAVQLAEQLRVHPSQVSQVLSGDRDFSNEQVILLAQHLGLSKLETDYLFHLVSFHKAGNIDAKKFFQEKLDELKKKSLDLSHRVQQDKILSDAEKSVFYSSYIYSATRLFCSIGEGKTMEEIIHRFQLSREKATQVLEFLLNVSLVARSGNKFVLGTQHTHVEKGSPHLTRHHLNWRVQALEKTEQISEEELQFTGVVSLSKNDFNKLREVLVNAINDSLKLVKASPAEEIACFNIDCFWIK